jgi:hypothetical protein
MEEEAMMNGYAPELETNMLRPQVDWKLIVRVEKVKDALPVTLFVSA